VKSNLLVAASAVALAIFHAPLIAQQHAMLGMSMPMPAKPEAKKTPKKAAPTKRSTKAVAGHKATPQPNSSATEMPGMTMPADHAHETMPVPKSGTAPATTPMGHQHMAEQGDKPMTMPMTGALGPYPLTRESSGTAWQPDSSEHEGLHVMSGDWMLMAHGVLNLVYDHQSGSRGDDKAFASGMLMGTARHPLGNGAVQFKAMLSPDPLMGKNGYPLLLASGETANGRDRLIDRQHPHDLFMELSASLSQNIGGKSSLFLYAGLPGEPAFGPPAFMHRQSILDSPEAPISHHWLDSTHISFGVLTAGLVLDRVKIEASRFNGREPDQHRWDIETGPLDSTAIRVSWNPARTLALQGSWGHFAEPEQLEPGIDQKRWSASALWGDEIAPGWKAAATLAWGRKTAEHHNDDAYVAEASVKHANWTIFGRAEITENRELLHVADGPAFRVGKASLGAVRDFAMTNHLALGAGGLVSMNFVPDTLAPVYGGHNPVGTMGFVRLKLR